MKYVGAHVSISGGVENAPVNAYRIGAKGFALFTKNQRQWVAAPYSAENVERFQQRCQEFGYLINSTLLFTNLFSASPFNRPLASKARSINWPTT